MQKETTTYMQIKEDLHGAIENFNSISMPKIPYRIEGVFTLAIVQEAAELFERFHDQIRALLENGAMSTNARIVGKLYNGEPIDKIDDWDGYIDEQLSENVYGGLSAFITVLAHHAGLTTEEERKDLKLKGPESIAPAKSLAIDDDEDDDQDEDDDDRRVLEDLEDTELVGILSDVLKYRRAESLTKHLESMGHPKVLPLYMTGHSLLDICEHYYRISNSELRDIQKQVLVWYLPNEFKVNDFEPRG